MKNKPQQFFHTTKTDSQFLFYKSDEKSGDWKSEDDISSKSMEFLAKTFPEMLLGQKFLDYATDQAQASPSFSAMVFQIDENPEKQVLFSSDKWIEIAKTIEQTCLSENGLCGWICGGLFGCIFAEKNDEFCLGIAKTIHQKLAEKGGQTVTIGIAAFPFIDFKQSQILENAQKAMVHASFFGPGSTVVFDAISLNISGDHYYQHGDIHAAIDEFTAALTIDNQNVNVLNSLGVCYGLVGDYDKAVSYFESAIQAEPEEAMAWYNTGLVYKLKKDNDKALACFLKAGEINGNLFEAAFQTGKIYFEKGLQETGRRYYRQAIDLTPQNDLNYRFLGECYAEMGLIDDAISAYKKAVKEHPNDAGALSALGCLFDQKGESPEIALLFCRQSVDISPENGLFRFRLGTIYLKQGKSEEATAEFTAAKELGFDATPLLTGPY